MITSNVGLPLLYYFALQHRDFNLSSKLLNSFSASSIGSQQLFLFLFFFLFSQLLAQQGKSQSHTHIYTFTHSSVLDFIKYLFFFVQETKLSSQSISSKKKTETSVFLTTRKEKIDLLNKNIQVATHIYNLHLVLSIVSHASSLSGIRQLFFLLGPSTVKPLFSFFLSEMGHLFLFLSFPFPEMGR